MQEPKTEKFYVYITNYGLFKRRPLLLKGPWNKTDINLLI